MTHIKLRTFKTQMYDDRINMNDVNKFETFILFNNVNVNKINDICSLC